MIDEKELSNGRGDGETEPAPEPPALRFRATMVKVASVQVGIFDAEGNQVGAWQTPEPFLLFHPHADGLRAALVQAEVQAQIALHRQQGG